MADRMQSIVQEVSTGALFGRYVQEVEYHAIMGNRDKAIEALESIVESGWRIYVSPDDPNLASLVDDPEYQRLMGVIQSRVDEELAKVREMEANGQLARTPDELQSIEFELDL